ncbi:MAG: hypothetical protein KAT05_15440, partial [Spirochaetes bacterium]|nr:hypothetical protein [Spirochaetota bacterium]
EIHRMVHSGGVVERGVAADNLCRYFSVLPNKEQAWKDFITLSKYDNVHWKIPGSLSSAFLHVPDKDRAWNDIISLTKESNRNTRIGPTIALGSVFSYITDKEQGFNDILLLTTDVDETVRSLATLSLGSAFPHILDKGKAWEVLIRLIDDDNRDVRWRAADALAPAFSHVLDKEKASKDILFLSKKNDKIVLSGVAEALGSVFSYVINKDEVWNILLNLSANIDGFVRISATYSLGQISIFKATMAESESMFHEELENAIEFFEKSLLEGVFNNPAEFCLPFYRSFHAITSRKKDAEAEIEINLREAKEAVWGSNSREKLLEVVENLSNALKDVEDAGKKDFNAMKSNLTDFKRYCDRACELLDSTEENAPNAVNLMRRGLPIVDEQIKKILEDIEEKSKNFCKDSKRTAFKNISRKTYENVKGLGEVNSTVEAEIMLNKSIPFWRSTCTILPKESGVFINELLDEMEVAELYEKAKTNVTLLSAIVPQMLNLQEKLIEKDKLIEYLKESVTMRLDNINYGVFKIKHRSAEMSLTLNQVQIELKKIDKIKNDLDIIGINVEEFGDLQNQNFQELNNEMNNICNIIELEIIPKLPENDD